MQETWVWSLGQEDPLEKEIATHPSTLAWKSHGQRSLVEYSPWGRKESDTTDWLHFHFCIWQRLQSKVKCSEYLKSSLNEKFYLRKWPLLTSSVAITLPTKVCIVKALVFPVVMYGCESWIMKKAECWRTDAFELWCQRRFLRVPWTARRLNQSILKEIHPEYSLEGLMLKLKLQNFGYLMWRGDSLEKTLMLGKIEGRRRRGVTEDDISSSNGWKASPTQRTCVWADSGRYERQGSLVCCHSWGVKESETTYQLNNNNGCHHPGQIPITSLLGVALNLGPHF